MRLWEFIDNTDLLNSARKIVLDYMTPLLSDKMTKTITVNQIIKLLNSTNSLPINVDREFVMMIMNPATNKAVSDITADKITLNISPNIPNKTNVDPEAGLNQVDKMAGEQVDKFVKGK